MKSILFLVLFLFLSHANEGVEFGKTTRDHFRGNFTTAVVQPLTSDKNFNTIDGSQSFKANLTCTSDSTQSFLTVSYSGNSDITINVSLDKNLDGSKETSYSFSGISAVGANGVVKCDPNSWSNCKSYLWQIENNALILKEATKYDLAGAYCINASCGNLASINKKDILDTVGGAISSLYQTYSSQYLITKTDNTGSYIEFFGQNFEDCTNLKNKGNEPAFSDTSDAHIDYGSEVLSQSADPLSPYSVLNDNINNQNNNISSKICTITNLVTVDMDTANKELKASGSSMCLDHFFEGRLNYNEVSRRLTMEIAGSSPSRTIGHNCGGAGWNKIIDESIEDIGIDIDSQISEIKADVKTRVWSGGCPDSTQTATFTSFENQRIILNTACSAGGAQRPNWQIDLILTVKSEKLVHSQDDKCTPFADDEECKLKTEKKIDTKNQFVYTVKNFNKTGIILEKHFSKVSGVKTWNIGYGKGSIDFYTSGGVSGFIYSGDNSEFKTEREYHCSSDVNYDYSDVKRVNKSVRDTATSSRAGSGYSFSYTAEQKDSSGTWQSSNDNGTVNFNMEDEGVKFCEVQYLVENTDVMSDGDTKQNTTGETSTFKVEARECTGDDYSICPVDSSKGEVIKSQCGDNDFGKVTALLSSVNEASKDIICSDD